MRRLPLLGRGRILGALHVPNDGLVKAARAAKLAAKAEAGGARFHGNTAVTGFIIDAAASAASRPRPARSSPKRC